MPRPSHERSLARASQVIGSSHISRARLVSRGGLRTVPGFAKHAPRPAGGFGPRRS